MIDRGVKSSAVFSPHVVRAGGPHSFQEREAIETV